ncbi:hypothetical protein [Halomonas sp. THAF12]|uniref:hypothetical protein n=1 Tax=Halomonas sp. THAF12 TaxID=2587849 RepID=UPI00126812EC|nr:hypothetical protein [Halomonas sp. THAF12]
MTAKENQTPRPDMAQPHRAGDITPFPAGKIIYLSPMPLPTGAAPVDFNQAIGEVNDAYLDLGGSLPTPFTWQFTLGIPFISYLMLAFLVPLIGGGAVGLYGKSFDVFLLVTGRMFNEIFVTMSVICFLYWPWRCL